jgi:hypothetical protein
MVGAGPLIFFPKNENIEACSFGFGGGSYNFFAQNNEEKSGKKTKNS